MDAELEILVRAVSDEKSADDATKEIVSRVFSKLKDGAIKLPINSKLDKADLKKLDDSMKQARKEVVSRYNKLLKDMDDPKGFDAFSDKAIKDLVELGKAYTTFNSKASGRSKNSLAAISEVKAALGGVFQLYENESRRLNSKIKELNLQDKVAKPLPSTRSKKSVQASEALDRYYDKQQKYSEQATESVRRKELFKELKEVRENQTHKSYGNHVIGGVATARTLNETEYYGSHRSSYGRQQAQEKAMYLPHELASLKVEKNKKKVDEYFEALRDGRARTKLTVPIDKIDKKNKLQTKFKDIPIYNNKPRKYTEEENYELKRDVTTNELAKILGGLEHRRPDASLELFKDYLESVFTPNDEFFKAPGKNSWLAIQETLEKTLNRYRGDRGTLGITDGTPKGEFEGHDTAVEAIKLMLDYFKQKAEYPGIEAYRQQKVSMKIDPKGTIKELEDPLGSLFKKLKPPKSDATVEKNSILAREIRNELSRVQSSSKEIFSEVTRGRKIKGIQLAYDKAENARESHADSRDEKVSTEHKNINRDVAKTVKADAASGFNTDAKAEELVSTSRQILNKLTDGLEVLKRNAESEKNTATEGASKTTPKKTSKKSTKKKHKETRLKTEPLPIRDEKRETLTQDKPNDTTPSYEPIRLFASTEAMRVAEAVADRLARSSATHAMLKDATHLGLPKTDGRRRYPSKGTIDVTRLEKEAAEIQDSLSTALTIIPGEGVRHHKESTGRSVLDARRNINIPDGKDTSYDDLQRRLADQTNARKQAEKKAKQKGRDTTRKLPKVIVPEEPLYKTHLDKSQITSSFSKTNQTIWERFTEAIRKATGATEDYTDIVTTTADKQDQLAAERIQKFGLNNGRNPNDTGDIASIKRALELFRTNKRSIEENDELAQNIKLTKGRDVNTTEVIEKFSDALSGKEMRNAQIGGSIPRQILGSMTLFAGMPSVEKSRAQADGLNQILGNVNRALNSVLDTIQMKETELSGMEKAGQIEFAEDGSVVEGTSAAKKTFADLEEAKLVLDSILADMAMVDTIIEKTGGKFSSMVKHLAFTSPVLRENNTIIRNIGSGLDKNGKALKHQSRLAEILNYTFQRIGHSIGQMFKAWIVQLNPITQIKNMFNDFASYNVKWQRTLNVVKYNLRSIILPMMDKIAQLLTNMIGFVDIILQKVQAAFGNTPISLFDQENAHKFKEEMEEIQSISAGFDELHDIGSGGDNDANNFFGEIYKPELSQEWIDLANRIGDLFAGIIKGDLGFGEVMKEILAIAIEGITLIGKEIWNALKSSGIAKYIEEQWASILATLAGMFIGWQLLKIAGKLVFNALTSHLTGTALGKSLSAFGAKITGWIGKAFSGSALKGTMATAGASLGQVFAVAFVSILAVVLGKALADWGTETLRENTNYNQGLLDSGGDLDDKKSNVGGTIATIGGDTLTGAGIGAAIGSVIPGVGTAIGAGIGALIGGIAGTFRAVLVPAIEDTEIAVRSMNNEMQKMEYYQGLVQGFSTQVSDLTELQRVLNDTLRLQTEKVYAVGTQLKISRQRMDELVVSVQNGTFHTGMLSGAELGLTDSLVQLSAQQEKNRIATEKLEAAKKKLQKAEIELAIYQDISAGNFELAAARVEYAVAAELMSVEDGTKKMVQIAKEGSAEQAAAILRDLSPDLQKKFQEEYGVVGRGLNELLDMYEDYSDDEKKYFVQNLTGQVQSEMQSRVNAIEKAVKNAPWYMRLLDIGNDGKIFGQYYIDVPKAATGTNYVASDGLAYIHRGEAIIPKKYNPALGQQGLSAEEQVYMRNMLMTMQSLDNTMKQGINVNGQFIQRGSDLVAVVNRTKSQTGADLLSNVAYAR